MGSTCHQWHIWKQKREVRKQNTAPVLPGVTKAYFWVRRWNFARWCQAREPICTAQQALPPEGPSLVIPKKAWHTQGDHHGCLCRHTLSGVCARLLSARQTRKAGNYISVFERLSRLTSPEMSFLDVSATEGSWAELSLDLHQRLLTRGILPPRGRLVVWGNFWSPWKGVREMYYWDLVCGCQGWC